MLLWWVSSSDRMSTGGFDVYSNKILAKRTWKVFSGHFEKYCTRIVHYRQKEAGKFKPEITYRILVVRLKMKQMLCVVNLSKCMSEKKTNGIYTHIKY